MSANDETVYIKIDQNVLVYDRNVTLGDIASLTSSNEAMLRQLKQKKIYTFPDDLGKGPQKIKRKVFSILKIIEQIHEDYPNAEVDNEFYHRIQKRFFREERPGWDQNCSIVCADFFWSGIYDYVF